MAVQIPKGAFIATIPVILIAAAVVQRRRSGTLPSLKSKPDGKPQVRRHKPKSRMRYYGLSLLINALERDSTRKAVIAALKLMQKRA